MKNTFSRWAIALSLALFSLSAARAQVVIPGIEPVNDDNRAESEETSGVLHTGTDALVYVSATGDPHDGQTMQVMTWDDNTGRITLSWSFYDNNGTINTPADSGSQFVDTNTTSEGSDPDVVLAYDNGKLYLNLVYIDGKYTRYDVYEWNGSQFVGAGPTPTRLLGDTSPVLTHAYPNIDANADGLVAITWQQSVSDEVTVNVTSGGNYFPAYSFVQTITFSRAYLVGGTITGNIPSCYYFNGFYGTPVLNPPTGLFEQTLHPDVAISEGSATEAVISSTFLRHYVDGGGLFSIINKLAVRQTYYNRCSGEQQPLDTLATHEWPYSYNRTLGSPRIAASPARATMSYGTDVEVVVDLEQASCGPTQYEVRTYGKSNGLFRPTYTLISPPNDPNFLKSTEPVVTFHMTNPNYYTISWTGGPGADGQNYDKGAEDDVWAVSLKEGLFVFPSTSTIVPDAYSRVNKQYDGNQGVSSIAGRHLGPDSQTKWGGAVHLFADALLHQLSYKRSEKLAGDSSPGSGLRPGPAKPVVPGSGPTNDGKLLQAYPNPAAGAVSIRLDLRPDERVLALEVRDLLGRSVADLLPTRSPEAAESSWTPNATLPTGNYMLRVVTSQRTQTQVINRQ